ncbi:hypothetical protein HKBW3S09_01630, partial [Candidatus Hakubella thermalkaliphila]
MVNSAKEVRKITQKWIEQHLADVKDFVSLGLPEIDDRYNVWRVPIVLSNATSHLIGEAKIGLLGNVMDSTRPELIRTRAKRFINEVSAPDRKRQELFYPAPIPNKVILGDAMKVLEELPPDTAQLVITSPPYYNAKPESCEFIDYQEYLNFLRGVIIRIREVLSEGRFFTINVSPVLVRRTSRSTSSKRIPIPFDVHQIMASAGFEFIDDIIWVKPEGAGWNLGRGRRFAADRQPLQY